jgi:DNA polymerase III epsilon subunit-like protein
MYLIFDTETTGLTKHPHAKDEVQPRIIEWAGILVDARGVIKSELELLINPGMPIPQRITEITGIKDEDVKDAPRFIEAAEELRPVFAKANTIIAHNLPFDSTMMELEIARNGIENWPWPKNKICTVQEHAEEFGRRPKLTELYEKYFDEKLNQTHRALDDVRALLMVCKAAGVII